MYETKNQTVLEAPERSSADAEVRGHDLSPREIQTLVARGNSLRARYIHDWAKNAYRTVRSLWRRPPMVPAGLSKHGAAHS